VKPLLENQKNGESESCSEEATVNVNTSARATHPGFQRPTLPSKDYESLLSDENQSQLSEAVYDYTGVDSW